MSLMEKIFGTHSSRELKRIMPMVDKIEALRPQMQALSDGAGAPSIDDVFADDDDYSGSDDDFV